MELEKTRDFSKKLVAKIGVLLPAAGLKGTFFFPPLQVSRDFDATLLFLPSADVCRFSDDSGGGKS